MHVHAERLEKLVTENNSPLFFIFSTSWYLEEIHFNYFSWLCYNLNPYIHITW